MKYTPAPLSDVNLTFDLSGSSVRFRMNPVPKDLLDVHLTTLSKILKIYIMLKSEHSMKLKLRQTNVRDGVRIILANT